MAVERGRSRRGQGGCRRAGSLPVLRWLQVGAAAAGVGVALVAAPTAQADAGAASSGADSSQEAGPSAGADTSSSADGEATADEASSAGEDASEQTEADDTADSTDTDLTPDQDSSEKLAEVADLPADFPEMTADNEAADPVADGAEGEAADTVGEGTDDEAADTVGEVSDSGDQGTPATAATETSNSDLDSSPAGYAESARSTAVDDPADSPTAQTEPMLSEIAATPDSTDAKTTSVQTATAPTATPAATAQSAPTSPAVANSTSRPDYPAPVSAPVTWRSIVTESLSWIGLGALAPNLPVPQFPVSDLIAGAWVGLRRLHYTFFNSAPRLQPGTYTQDPFNGVITGDLGGYDADGDVITYVVDSAPEHGTVLIDDDGTYTYTPDSEFALAGGIDTFSVVAQDTGAANPWHIRPISDLFSGLATLLSRLGLATAPDSSTATLSLNATPVVCEAGDSDCGAAARKVAPSITVHNSSDETIWVYNLPKSANYSIPKDFHPVKIEKGSSAPVTLAVGTGKPGEPKNRIYIVEGDKGFTLPVDATSGVDAFDPTAVSERNSFLNYNFMEYFLYPAHGGYEYTIDTSYIDEWSLPIQVKFDLHDSHWSGAVNGKTYGFNDFDTVVSQLNAAGKHLPDGGPYKDLVWSGPTPWVPQPPPSVKRIIGPDKVWSAQSLEPPANFNMNKTGWVPKSYQDFVQYGTHTADKKLIHPYAYNGNKYSTVKNNFDFWRDEVAAPGGTPYPIALRTAAHLDGFPAAHGKYGFFTYPNDEGAGQFTNIPNSVSMDIYVHGTSDGLSDSVTEGGRWLYSSSPTRSDADLLKPGRNMLVGTDATDTFILDYLYKSRRSTPLVIAQAQDHDIVAIDKTSLVGAISNEVDIVDCFWFLGHGFANYDSQFIYDRSSGLLYYDQYPDRFGYTGVLANLSLSQIDPADAVFVL